MRHFLSLLVGDIVAFAFLWDIPMLTRISPERWLTEWVCAVVLLGCAFVVCECLVSAWHVVRVRA